LGGTGRGLSYALNNPLKYIDPSGEFFWIIPHISWSKNGGFSFGVSFVFGIPGIISFQVGAGISGSGGYAFAGATAMFNTIYASYSSAGFSVGYTAGTSMFSGLPVSTNLGTLGINYNFSNSSWSGNISAWGVDKNGWSFNPSVSAMLFPEHTTNFFRKGRFVNNDKMLKDFVDAEDYQGALKYFGFKATYDRDYTGGDPGYVNAKGDIFLGSTAFNKGFDKLHFSYEHEMKHRANILSGKYDGRDINHLTLQEHGEEEFSAYSYNYKRVGLYRKHGFNLGSRLNNSLTNWGCSGYIDMLDYYIYNSPKWHFIYTIKRLW